MGNVVFDRRSPRPICYRSFQQQHRRTAVCQRRLVRLTPFTSAAAHGQDIKITLRCYRCRVQVFWQAVPTGTTKIFSLSGTGTITTVVNAVIFVGVAEDVQPSRLGAGWECLSPSTVARNFLDHRFQRKS